MSAFVYLVAEGVHDVAFLGRVLTVLFKAKRVRRLADLDDGRKRWFSSFKWPVGEQIDRLAVPAPVVYRAEERDAWITLRGAEGDSKIVGTLEDDLDLLSRVECSPGSIGIVLDSDDEPKGRYRRLRPKLEALQLKVPETLTLVEDGSPRVGALALPGTDVQGTLEDILLALGDAVYPELTAAARLYAQDWHAKVAADAHKEWSEMKKPAGLKKATIGAMTAMLKPGKSTQVSLEDNRWISDASRGASCLVPCARFLEALLPAAAAPHKNPRDLEGS